MEHEAKSFQIFLQKTLAVSVGFDALGMSTKILSPLIEQNWKRKMLKLGRRKYFRNITSFAAFSFLLWTLCSPTFLDVSSGLVDKSLSKIKKASDRASTQMISLADQLIR